MDFKTMAAKRWQSSMKIDHEGILQTTPLMLSFKHKLWPLNQLDNGSLTTMVSKYQSECAWPNML